MQQTGVQTPYCPCGHRWLGHATGAVTGRHGAGLCFAQGCNCQGQDVAEYPQPRGWDMVEGGVQS